MASMITYLQTAFSEFSVDNIIAIITAALTIAIPLIIGWFAFRWVFGKVKKAFKGGRA